jgi:ATP-dependent Lhr-like helicase
VAARDIEPLRVLRNPLDVLAQIIVSMTASEPWQLADLLALLQRSGPYETLSTEQLVLVVEMLAGRYAGSRVRELQPRISYDRITNTVRALRSAVLAYYNAGGVIPDRGYFQLRHADSGAVIGELDEEFVWEASLGQVFTLGTQNWQIQRITHNDVLVKPARAPATLPPFWRSETQNRSFHFSCRIGAFLAAAESILAAGKRGQLTDHLVHHSGFESAAAEELAGFLERQREETGAPLPHREHVLLERLTNGPGGYRGPGESHQLVIHSLWGGQVNRPWALALGSALETRCALVDEARPEIHADDSAIVITTRSPLDPALVPTLVNPANLEELLRPAL